MDKYNSRILPRPYSEGWRHRLKDMSTIRPQMFEHFCFRTKEKHSIYFKQDCLIRIFYLIETPYVFENRNSHKRISDGSNETVFTFNESDYLYLSLNGTEWLNIAVAVIWTLFFVCHDHHTVYGNNNFLSTCFRAWKNRQVNEEHILNSFSYSFS